MSDIPSGHDTQLMTTTHMIWIRSASQVLLSIGLGLSAGCIPEQEARWQGSIVTLPDARCKVEQEYVVCNGNGYVQMAVGFPGLVVEIPLGHAVRLTAATATIIPGDGSGSWEGHIVTSEGFRYKDSNSSERIYDRISSDATRELVGSSWIPRHSSEKLHGSYRFEIRSERPYPQTVDLQLPDIVVDGETVVMPRMSFRYGKHLKFQGLFGA